MYAFIEGRVCEKTTNSLVLEAGGIGYQLNCSMTTLQEAPSMGEKMRCYTYLSVREDAMELFGFATKEEKRRKNRARSARRYAPARLESCDFAGGCQRPLPRAGHRQKDGAANRAGTQR